MGNDFSITIGSYLSSLNNAADHSSLIWKLMTNFRNNTENAELVNYLSEQNIFDIIGKGRDELTHSRMLADIFCGSFFSVSEDSAIHRLLDLLVERAFEQGISIDDEIKSSVLTSSLQITDCADVRTEYPVSKYLSDYAGNTKSASKGRIDLFMRLKANGTEPNGKHVIELFVENKIGSREHSNQTQHYHDQCSDGRRAAQFFVYLTVDGDNESSARTRKRAPAYIHITYQDIMDKILCPMLKSLSLNQREKMILKEYINCLELPSLKQENNPSAMIMATSGHEKQLIDSFWSNKDNRQLVELVVNSVVRKKMYSCFTEDLLSFDEAVSRLLVRNLKGKGLYSTLRSYCPVCGTQNEGFPFVINCVKTTASTLYYLPIDFFEYDGEVYQSIPAALIKALSDYCSRTGVSDKNELVELFKPIYGRQKGGRAVLVTSEAKDYMECRDFYIPTELDDLFVRSSINLDKLTLINEILGIGHYIKRVTETSYNNLACSQSSSLLREAKKSLYIHVPGTSLWFRKGQEDKLDKINNASDQHISECSLSEYDEQLLRRFYEKHRQLIISIHRILIENETDESAKQKLMSQLAILPKERTHLNNEKERT